MTLLGIRITVRRTRKPRPVLCLTPEQADIVNGGPAPRVIDLSEPHVLGFPVGTRTAWIRDGWGWER